MTAVTTQKPGASPSRGGLHCEIPADPCAIVIFGASGDLARRKLIPALYELAENSCLAPRFVVLGFGRTALADDAFRDLCRQALVDSGSGPLEGTVWGGFSRSLFFESGSYDDPAAYMKLAARLDQLDRERGLRGNRLYYLATPPEIYRMALEQLGRAGLQRAGLAGASVRVIIEKPFGRDLVSSRALNRAALSVFDESQIYRIDHYLGKETVQNLLVFRFSNGIFEPLWNRNYIDNVQISVAETLGVERRAAFYETAGALRDMFQNHIMQLVSFVALEPPARFDATAVRNEKIKVLQSIRPFHAGEVGKRVVRGQYGSGQVNGAVLSAYREEPGVQPNSTTETYVAAKIEIENWRWAGVPFYVRTGKRLARRTTEIAVHFRRMPHHVFHGQDIESNTLVLNIQPDEGISISFGAKVPGPEMRIESVRMDFNYESAFGKSSHNAYATLLNDCLRNDATLFDRGDSVEAAWALVEPIQQEWNANSPSFPNYPAGSPGPSEADALLERDGRRWRSL
jgi:glucose-6-phosphate 1-dehydrogenase